MQGPEQPRVTRTTRDAEAEEAEAGHVADSVDEEAAARAPDDIGNSVRHAERDMAERGVRQQGEGRIP